MLKLSPETRGIKQVWTMDEWDKQDGRRCHETPSHRNKNNREENNASIHSNWLQESTSLMNTARSGHQSTNQLLWFISVFMSRSLDHQPQRLKRVNHNQCSVRLFSTQSTWVITGRPLKGWSCDWIFEGDESQKKTKKKKQGLWPGFGHLEAETLQGEES